MVAMTPSLHEDPENNIFLSDYIKHVLLSRDDRKEQRGERQVTNYIVFTRTEGDQWLQFTAIYARSARAAIAQAVSGDDPPYTEGQFCAVPVRSWKPVTVKVETKTALRFS